MASPVYSSPASPGNLIASGTSIAAGNSVGAFVDASAWFQAIITPKFLAPATLGTTPLATCSAYDAYAETTLSAAASSGATSISVASAAGITVGQQIALPSEIVTVSAVSGTTLTVSALVGTYSSGASVYLIEQTPSASAQVGSAYAVNTVYSKSIYLDTARYFIALTNGDTVAWTGELTLNSWTAVA